MLYRPILFVVEGKKSLIFSGEEKRKSFKLKKYFGGNMFFEAPYRRQ